MDLLEAVQARCLAASAVSDIVGTRIYKVKRPQGSPLPALVVASAGGAGESLDLQDEADTSESRVQFSAFAETNYTARELVRAATNLFVGDAVEGNVLFWEGQRDPPIDLGEDTPQGFIHHVTQDVLIRHSAGS